MSYSRLKQNLRAAGLFWMATILIVALWTVAQKRVDAQSGQLVPASVTAQQVQLYGIETQSGWTADQMAAATPKELFVYEGDAKSTVGSAPQNLGPNAQPQLFDGYDPARSLARMAQQISRTLIPSQPMTSPPFSGPANPTDYGNYSPFQRWTHFGSYFTYPMSTVGKLFFNQNGGSFVCSASVWNRNTLLTAGHCVHAGNNSAAGWSSNFVFCPSYTPGGCIAGQWGWTTAFTSAQWFSSGLPDRDFACIVTNRPGGAQIGNQTGWIGWAVNFPTRQAEFAQGYPQAAPFNGQYIISATSTEWYQQDFAADAPLNHVSKYIGSDMTGGSSGGPWWLSHRHPNAGIEFGDTDGSNLTDPGQGGGPFANGLNSHKRCNAAGCPAGSIFTQEMGSPQFLDDGAGGDLTAILDVYNACAGAGGS
jgi:V8-like Glu-specific endopeptidase